jgi:hypothetical protein
MALATGETLNCLNSSLINKDVEKRSMMKFVHIHALSRNLRHADATEDSRSMSSVTMVYIVLPSAS